MTDPKKPTAPAETTPCEDEIDEAGEESFPASDPPAHSQPDPAPDPAPDPHRPD